MKSRKTSDYKLRIPSHINIVNIRNMKGFIKILDRLPERFGYEDVSNISEYTVNNIVAISRILTYLKYLGVIKNIKGRGKKFQLTETGEELKKTIGNPQYKFIEKWSQTIKNSELYNYIINIAEFQKYGFISSSHLKELIKESFSAKVKNEEERSDKAFQFLLQLFEDAKLFYFDGKCLKPMNQEPIEEFYHAKTDDYELRVKFDSLAFEMLKMQIDIARKKFESIKKSKKEEQKDE